MRYASEIVGYRMAAAAGCVTGLVALVIGSVLLVQDLHLASSGVRVQGTVISDPDPRIQNVDGPVNILVSYPVLQLRKTKRFQIQRIEEHRYYPGTEVEVIVDPMHPSGAKLAFEVEDHTTSGLALVFGLLFLGAGIYTAVIAAKMVRDQKEEAPDLEEALRAARRVDPH